MDIEKVILRGGGRVVANGVLALFRSPGDFYTDLRKAGRALFGISGSGDIDTDDPEVAALAGVTSSADTLFYFTGAGTGAVTGLTSQARGLLDDASYSAMRTTLGLVIGTDVQPYDGDLAAIAALSTAADRLPYATGSGTWALATFTAFGRSLVDDADAATARNTLGLGTIATLASDTDTTLAANSDSRVATQKAVKAYADGLIAANDAMVFKGVIDCSANPNYPAADRGWTYRVSVAGKIGGGSGVNVEIGDILLCLTDGTASGNQATVGAQWNVVQSNVDGAVTGPTSAVANRIATFNGTTGKIIQDGGKALPSGDVVGTTDAQTLTGKTLESPTIAGVFAIINSATDPAGIELGRRDGTSSTPFIDWHSGAVSVDRDFRMQASGGTGSVGGGSMTMTGAAMTVNTGAFLATGAYSTTTANAANVNVASDGTLARSTSSEKYKTDIEPMADAYADMIFALQPIWYRSTCARDNPEHSFWGLSAEAVAAIDPRLVHWKTHETIHSLVDVEVVTEVDGETVTTIEQQPHVEHIPLDQPEPEGVAYERLTVHLIAIAQRQQAQIAELTARLDALSA